MVVVANSTEGGSGSRVVTSLEKAENDGWRTTIFSH